MGWHWASGWLGSTACRYIIRFESGFAPLSQQYANIVKLYSYARNPSNKFCSLSTFRLGKEQPHRSGHIHGFGDVNRSLHACGPLHACTDSRACDTRAAWLEYLRYIQDNWAQGFCCTTCGKYPATIVVDGTNLICRALFPVDSPTVGMRPYETGRSGIKRSPPIKDQCNPDISLTTSYFRVYMQPL